MRDFRPLLAVVLLASAPLGAPAQLPSVQSPPPSSFPASSSASKPIAELNSADATVKGAVIMTASGAQVMSGSSVAAGDSTALLRLARGGQLRICPRSVLSLSATPGGNELMLAMSSGSIETDYQLAASADTIVTPDFRLVLAGPGRFRFAIGADARGNTCVRALPGNTSSLLVYEQMGDGVYQVHSHDQVMFSGGSVAAPELFVSGACGCPAPQNLTAEVKPLGTTIGLPPPTNQASAAQSAAGSAAPALPPPSSATPALPPTNANEVHVQVDAPFVFRATDVNVPPAPVVARLRLQSLPKLPATAAVAPAARTASNPPQSAEKPAAKKGLFGHLRAFFAGIFR